MWRNFKDRQQFIRYHQQTIRLNEVNVTERIATFTSKYFLRLH